MSLLGIQLPSISDIVNGFVSAVANTVNTVVKWLADSVGWLWSQIYNYIVKPIGDFINWLFETAKGTILSPILGFLGNAINVIQKKAFGTLYIAITYKLMYKEMLKLTEVKDVREGLKEAFWLVLKPMIIYLALSMFWKMMIISAPASAFGVPPALSGQFTPVPPPSVAQPPTPSSPLPWQITFRDTWSMSWNAGATTGLLMELRDAWSMSWTADMVLPGTFSIRDTWNMSWSAGAILPSTIQFSDTWSMSWNAGMGMWYNLQISDAWNMSWNAGVGITYEVTASESEPTLVLSGGVS
jgi:hypothetical protein